MAVRRVAPGLPEVAAVALGGLLGSASRIAIGTWFTGSGFPMSVLLVNLVGSFLLGLYLAVRQRVVTRAHSVHFWAIGLLGSFTTFSTFSVDILRLVGDGRPVTALVYLLVSLVAGLSLAFLGGRIGRLLR